jgi:hypothetical protein
MFGYITKPAGPPDLSVVGGNLAVASVPVALVKLADGVASYETMFSNLDMNGQPRNVVYGGSWGVLAPAGRPH